ncbi:MAG: hypothetical protein M5R41_06180 [Bacteroidia bacterium]|nr:hypothetical protein [Bacteroidia bacterium]
MMLVLGAMVLLSLLVLNINRTQLFSEQQMSQSEYIMAATAVGQSMVNEAAGKAFDAATATDEKATVATFTAPGSLGRGSWEAYPNFNDFDDYHRYSTTRSTPRAGSFRLLGAVDYVNPATPNKTSSVRTRMKRLRVTITSEFMEQPVILVHYKSH